MYGWILYAPSNKPDLTTISGSPGVDRLVQVAKQRQIDLKVINPNEIDLVITQDDPSSIYVNGQKEALPDFIIPRTGSGTPYFIMAVIRHLERLGIPSFNTSEGIELVRDKLYSQQVLSHAKLPVPKTILLKFPISTQLVEQYLGFPVIVKPVHGSKGSGVVLSENMEAFNDLMQLLEASKPNVNIILQEYIASSKGHDVRIFVLGGKVLGCMHRISTDGSFKSNFSRGGSVEAYPLNTEMEWIALEAVKALKLDIAGVDLLFDGDHYRICEVNACPGFKGFEKVHPTLSVPDEIYNYIQFRLGV